ncbi:Cobalt-zinc-cadmium resistance protein [Streptococcus sp. DD10]|uniref:cation diffusion facilitator family transporter n=1 Tax=Streptococcus sp. DD10 TaxID=1777878 RepID=UPI0007996202|nr:cation diffusion facilitator family transporter [Streptococcus sp. DD10]KXT73807.1 Cobalt-zinc-cadmium resistance protein [Streptococcus sp. DD10]
MNSAQNNLKLAERGAIISIIAYLVLSAAKLATGHLLSSSSLVADGFNNLSDIISNVALLIGIRLARQPADRDHKFGHWKIEDLASLITSIIMFYVGFDVLRDTIQKILSNQEVIIDPLGAIVGFLSAIVMFCVYLYNRALATKANSKALQSSAKDNISDAVTSLGTSIAIVASALNYPLVDKLVAIIITFFILKTAYDIFIESSFSLSDGFDESLLADYEKAIMEIPKISRVKSQRGRTYGSNIYLDVVLEMNPDLSVYESHAITEKVEQLLKEKFNVFDIDVHVEPTSIPEDEILDNVLLKLKTYEQRLYAQQEYQTLLADNFTLINEFGQESHKKELLQTQEQNQIQFSHFEIESISQKTKLVRYELSGQIHTSIWRRHEIWQKVFHQITSKKE